MAIDSREAEADASILGTIAAAEVASVAAVVATANEAATGNLANPANPANSARPPLRHRSLLIQM
jgi:hypothetical protein